MTKLEEELKALEIEKVKLEIESLKKPVLEVNTWNSLEICKFIMSVILPVIILVATCNLKQGEEARANDSRIAALRFEKFGQLSEHLNNIYCYFTYKGQWKELTPIDIIYEKRTADKIQNMNSFLFSDTFNLRYERFIKACFLQGSGGWGKDALLRTEYKNRDTVKPTTRRRDTTYSTFNWDKNWNGLFITYYPEKYKDTASTTNDSVLNDYGKDVEKKYKELIDLIGEELKTNVSKK